MTILSGKHDSFKHLPTVYKDFVKCSLHNQLSNTELGPRASLGHLILNPQPTHPLAPIDKGSQNLPANRKDNSAEFVKITQFFLLLKKNSNFFQSPGSEI